MDWYTLFLEINTGIELVSNLIVILGIGGITFMTNKALSKIQEQRAETLFGYYSRMIIHLLSIKRNLGGENNTPLLNGLYKKESEEKSDSYCRDEKLFSLLEKNVCDFLDFLKSENWQIPLDKEFEKNFQQLIENMYIILDVYSYKIYNTIGEVTNAHKKITQNITDIISDIKKEQYALLPKKK